MKDKLKNISRRVFYILFSIAISIALWVFVEIAENELQVRMIDVAHENIILKNQELLNSRGLLVSDILTDNLTLTFEGSRSDISRLLADTVYVEVDLENVRSQGTVALNYAEILPESVNANAVNVIRSSTSQVILVIDRLLMKEIPVEVYYTGGTLSDDIIAEQAEVEPRMITVSGPEEIVSQIAHVYVPILAENLFTTYSDELYFLLVDANGEELDYDLRNSDTLTFSQETVRVTVPVRHLKKVTLQAIVSHGETTSDAITALHISPSEITVAGDADAVRDFNSIMLGTIDMTSFSNSTTRTFPITLPNNVSNVSGETEATIAVEILALSGLTTEFRSVSSLFVDNVPVGHTATILTQSLDVRVRGTPQALAEISAENIWIVADLTDLGTGTSYVNARASLVGTEAEVDIIKPRVDSDYRIVVTITEDNGGVP